ncbi:TetR/AcrR family transcriptional regulator [Streptomyces sp. NPDC005438]|uniref:TetR/AcrR family transcriptional regulator n=1 Tax=Streptomyces sp. NPDC005438 TaxID=3156880 RepID=UPI0033A0C535
MADGTGRTASTARRGAGPRDGGPRRGGLSEKRDAILRAALTTFGRDGYTRASVDTIAGAARVSTRTIYNHFAGKEELFRVVIQDSASQVADHQVELLRQRARRRPGDLEEELVGLCTEWSGTLTAFPDHFALVRQVNAEAGHIPPDVLATWNDVGPDRAQKALADHLEWLAEGTPLRPGDPERAASHLTLLVSEINLRSYYGLYPLPDEEVRRIVTSAVRAFLHGHLDRC